MTSALAFPVFAVGLLLLWDLCWVFKYEVGVSDLVVTWRFLDILPLKRTRIPLNSIVAMRPLSLSDLAKGMTVSGRILSSNRLVIHRDSGMFRRVYVSPQDPALFREELQASGARVARLT